MAAPAETTGPSRMEQFVDVGGALLQLVLTRYATSAPAGRLRLVPSGRCLTRGATGSRGVGVACALIDCEPDDQAASSDSRAFPACVCRHGWVAGHPVAGGARRGGLLTCSVSNRLRAEEA